MKIRLLLFQIKENRLRIRTAPIRNVMGLFRGDAVPLYSGPKQQEEQKTMEAVCFSETSLMFTRLRGIGFGIQSSLCGRVVCYLFIKIHGVTFHKTVISTQYSRL
jgi:hypothetical protein